VSTLVKFRFQILHNLNREYPVAPERSGSPADYANYVSFLKNLKGALGAAGHKYGLSITIPSSYWYMQHFDIVQISSIIDWFNVMSYDLHGKSHIGNTSNRHYAEKKARNMGQYRSVHRSCGKCPHKPD
jgi:GH18 family chitinase